MMEKKIDYHEPQLRDFNLLQAKEYVFYSFLLQQSYIN